MATPKMQPFWWFLPPPSPACWRNSCENCDDWTKTAALVCSIDTTDYKEGSGCIVWQTSPLKPADGQEATIPVGTCDKYFGFWVQPTMPNQNSYAALSWVRSDGYLIGFEVSNLDYAPVGRWIRGRIYLNGALEEQTLIRFTDGQWYWLEITYDGPPNASDYHWYVNGELKWTYSTAPAFGDPQTFNLNTLGNYYLGTVKLDFIRRATKLEYPPT